MTRPQLPMKIETLFMVMTLTMTSVVAQSASSNEIAELLPCRQVTSGSKVDQCYALYRSADNRKSHERADQMCREKHGAKGRLMTIPDNETQVWLETELNLSSAASSGQFWIGAKYSGNEWTWHGDENEPLFYSNWLAGQTGREHNRCAYVEKHSSQTGQTLWKWQTDVCSSVKNFLCEYPDNRCGRPNPRHEQSAKLRLAGGTKAAPHSWPWMVSLQDSEGHACGGSLISDRMVLTAAHCMENFHNEFDRIVLLGAHNLRNETEPYRFKAHVNNFILHPKYAKKTPYSNDIMLLELDEPISFNHGIKPVCLPPSNQAYPQNRTCIATGWGINNDTSQCCPLWVAQLDTEEEIDDQSHVFEKSSSLYDCQYRCFHKKNCVGINFHTNQTTGHVRCVAILSSSSQRYRSVIGVDHYSLRRECAGCRYVWTVHENRAVMSNQLVTRSFEVESQYDCQLNCSDTDECSAFNYHQLEPNQSNLCELLLLDVESNSTIALGREDIHNSPGTNFYELSEFFRRSSDYDLKQALLPVVSQSRCRLFHQTSFDVDSMMCAGRLGGPDACHGDSGGPLICQEPDDSWMLYGVTNWGTLECGLGNKPGVYALVAPHSDWIRKNMNRSAKRITTTTPGPSVEETTQEYNCHSNNPCTLENVERGWRCYTTSSPNPDKFLFCTSNGRCMHRDADRDELGQDEEICYFAIRQERRIAREEGGASNFRIRIL